jgi:hypothetical protein
MSSLWGWRRCSRPAKPAGVQSDVKSSTTSSSWALETDIQQNRPNTSQLDAAETGQGVHQAFNEPCHPSVRPSTTGSRIPGPVQAHTGKNHRHTPVTGNNTRRPASPAGRSPTRMPGMSYQEHLMSGALPTPPDSGSRATVAGWAAEVYRGLNSESPDDEHVPRPTSETPEWLTPKPAPGDPSLKNLAAATKRCLYPDEAEREGPRAAKLVSNNPFRELGSHSRAEGATKGISRSTPEGRASRTARFREALDRIDKHKDTPPPLPSRHPARESTDQFSSSPESSPASSQAALMSATKTHASASRFHNPFADDDVTSGPGTDTPSPPPRAHLPSTSRYAVSMPAHLQRNPTPPEGQGARIASIEYALLQTQQPETSAEIRRRTLGAIQEEFIVAGEALNEKLARTSRDRDSAIAAINNRKRLDRPAAVPKFTWCEIAALGAIGVGVSVYVFVMLAQQRMGMAYVDWKRDMHIATLRALDGGGRTSFRASTPDDAEMYMSSQHTVTLDERQRENVCMYNTMPTFNLTSSHRISGMQNLTPRGAGFPAVGIPSFGQAVSFCMMICGVYTLVKEVPRRAFRKWELRRYEKGSVSLLGKALDSLLAWGEVGSVLLSSVFTALLVSGIVTAVLQSKM